MHGIAADGTVVGLLDRAWYGSSVQWRKNLELAAWELGPDYPLQLRFEAAARHMAPSLPCRDCLSSMELTAGTHED